MTEQLVEAVARAILESDPTCDYDACRERLARDRFGLEQNWWEGLHRQARNAIAEVCKISNAETGMMVGDADVTDWLRFMAAVSRAGLDGVTPHTLRHTAASWTVNGGASMEFAAKLLGHRDPNTTRQIYSHPDVDSLRPAADVIDMRIRRKV